MHQNQTVVIIGGGVMGQGIAQLFVQQGFHVVVIEKNQQLAKQIPDILEKSWQFLISKGKFSHQQVTTFLSRLLVSCDNAIMTEASVVIEAVFEDLAIKQDILKQAEKLAPAHTLLASNTSTLSITAIASALDQPQRLIGLHFFNPPPVMKLVEVIKGLQTDSQYLDQGIQLVKDLQKQPIVCKSFPGFIVNRACRPYYCESFKMLDEQAGTIDNIDAALEGSGLFPMGIFRLVDLIGVDTNFRNTQSMFETFYYDNRYKPSLTQLEYVHANLLGKKTGQGLYRYQNNQAIRQINWVAPHSSDEPRQVMLYSPSISHFCIENLKAIAAQKQLPLNLQENSKCMLQIDEVEIIPTNGQIAESLFPKNHTPAFIMDWILSEKVSALAIQPNHAVENKHYQLVASFFAKLGIQLICVKSPAMVVMRLLSVLINEILEMTQQNVCHEDDASLALQLGMNFQFNAMQLAQQIGYDHIFQMLNNLYQLFQDEKYRPSLELKKRILNLN